jgi:hypothetical protein
MDLLYVLLILLVVSSGFGEVAEHLGQPGLVGPASRSVLS